MPLEAVAITSFDAPIMRDTKHTGELKTRIAKLYTDYAKSMNAVIDVAEVMAVFSTAFKRGAVMYVGMFNDKPICVLGCFDDGQTDSKRLQYLAVHPENLDRGIEGRFIKQIYDLEVKKGVRQFMPVDSTVHHIMSEYEMLRVKP